VTARDLMGVLVLAVLLLGMLGALRLAGQRYVLHREVSRKLAHVGLGLASLSYPWLFSGPAPVLLIGTMAVTTLVLLRVVPALRTRFGGVIGGVDRASGGDLYFPIAATGLFLLSGGDPLLYSIPILTLAFADAMAALTGVFYAQVHYAGVEGRKSVEGSAAFLLVAFLATHVPLLLFSDVGRAESLLIGLTFGMLVMLLEAIAWRGLDNLFIPFGGFLLLRTFVELDAPALVARFLVTVGLLVLVVMLRRQRTMTDAAIVAGVLVGYVAWSVGGWAWLVPPFVLFMAYSALWPRTANVRDRPHDVVAVFSVTGCGLLWLLLAPALGSTDFYYPYTLTFAANLVFIGVTWWLDYRRTAPAWRGVLTSALVAWGAALPPFVAVAALYGQLDTAWRQAVLALPLLAVAGAAFVVLLPHQRNRPSRDFPWGRQAMLALATSAVAWLVASLLSPAYGWIPA
jgi:phytol kinase